MDERSGTVRLVESQPDAEARGLVATVSRDEVEEVLRTDEGPVALLLDVERVAADGDAHETERIALAWEPQDLERLLATTSGDQIALTFDEQEIRRLLDDVEAHGMREKLAVLSVVAGMAAAGAGSATAAAFVGTEGGSSAGPPGVVATHTTASEVSTGLTGVSSDRVTASEVSTGLGDAQAPPAAAQTGRSANPSEISTGITGEAPAAPSEISTGIVQEPLVTPAEVTTGIVEQPTATPASASPSQPSDWAPSPVAAALAAGTILALTAVGFALRAQRRPPPAVS
jgi:hypothetical protein